MGCVTPLLLLGSWVDHPVAYFDLRLDLFFTPPPYVENVLDVTMDRHNLSADLLNIGEVTLSA